MQPDPPIQSNDSEHSDIDNASETCETNPGEIANDTTSLLLEIRHDVKKMHKRFDRIEKSVKTLKHDSKHLKDQNVKLSKQVTELQTTVAHLEIRTREADIKNERLEAQSRRDNLRFYGFDDKQDETWEESENTIRSYIANELNLFESSVQIERAHRIPSKTSPRPVIVKFSFYKDRDKVLNAYRDKRKHDNEQRRNVSNNEGATGHVEEEQGPGENIRVCEDFPQRVIKARSKLYPFLRSSIDNGREAYLKYDRLYVDGQPYEYDYDLQRPVPVRK